MTFNKEGKRYVPLAVFEVNGSFIIGVYQGGLSKYDILIKYRQYLKNKWSSIRTPKHIHWAVDILIKLHKDQRRTQAFLDFLLKVWKKTRPVNSRKAQKQRLNMKTLLTDSKKALIQYSKLDNQGEYNLKFLILLAKLLMIQEKTNYKDAYMFRLCLEALRNGKDIFSVVSIASHVGR